MDITICGKRLIHSYHHYIMTLELNRFQHIDCSGYHCREITLDDIEILKKGDFSLPNMIPYLKKEKKYSTGFLFFDASDKPVGYIWVVRRGGNEMIYKVRCVEALISCVCVFKEFRGRNIANIMIGKIVELLRNNGGKEVALGVRTDNAPAIRAYEKAGFKVTGEKRYLRVLRKNIPCHEV